MAKVEGGEVLEQLAQGWRLESGPVSRLQLGRCQAVGHVAAEAVVVVEAHIGNAEEAFGVFRLQLEIGRLVAVLALSMPERMKCKKLGRLGTSVIRLFTRASNA